MFKGFLCICLYFQDLFYNKYKKADIFLFWVVSNLEELIIGFLGETRGGTVHWMCAFLAHTHAYTLSVPTAISS